MSPRTPLLMLLVPWLLAAEPVGRVLVEDPPLPGESLAGWEALAPLVSNLELEQAVAMALSANPRLALAQAEIDAALGRRRSAMGPGNPEITLREAELGVEIDLSRALLTPLRSAAAAPEVDAARLLAAAEALRLGVEVRAAFFELQAATAGWVAAVRAVDGMAASRDAALALFRAGNLPERDLTLRIAAYEDMRLAASERELSMVGAEARLARLLGPGAPTPLRVSPQLPDAPSSLPQPAALESEVLSANLELRALRLGEDALRAQRSLATVPHLSLELELAPGERAVGLGVAVPLGSPGRGAWMSATAELDALAAQITALEWSLRATAREVEARRLAAHRRALFVRDVLLPARQALLDQTLLQFNAMQVDIDALLDAWRQRVQAEAQLADALRELATVDATLNALLAGATLGAPTAVAASTPTSTQSGEH